MQNQTRILTQFVHHCIILAMIKLIQRIENEIPVIDKVVTKTIDAWIKGAKEPSEVQDVYLESFPPVR